MIKEPALILIDEFGNAHTDLSKEGTFSHFIYCSLIVPLSKKEEAYAMREQLSKNYFFGQALKSRNLGAKYFERRLAAIKELTSGLDFTIDILVIDKSKIEHAEGLKYKSVFYKYFQSLFVGKYNQRYQSFEITCDEVGEKFRNELEQYVRTNGIQADLFNPDRTFYLKEDVKEEPLIQLADLVCGCAGKIFCSSHADVRAKELFNVLHGRMSVSYFPNHLKGMFLLAEKDSTVDAEIAEVNLSLIQDFYQNNHLRHQNEYLRLIDYLVLYNRIDNTKLISTYEIVNYLQQFSPDMTEEKVRLLVRNLRYEGLFIVSHSGKTGYKLAVNYQDIKEYFNHFSKYVIPMLRKIQIFNETLSANTFNKINPLEKDSSLLQLKELLSAL
ncbi:DUF3800 domain-containing protein [Mucilaginibacter arboris]|uniref:DUF3800 domain-containing protein n=1 Tax=Mucilaginibacter arboris TaxID=2682090 RepID=A0A7K1T083_9SPHI|nr:DUF3800 domain-containing protein [Mucilaginibacter arboris]MVN22976.1 DUF3800 domain-containing protein [Mucilaginibacter arboris]